MKYQIAIIGGGPAGYTAAEAAGKAGPPPIMATWYFIGQSMVSD